MSKFLKEFLNRNSTADISRLTWNKNKKLVHKYIKIKITKCYYLRNKQILYKSIPTMFEKHSKLNMLFSTFVIHQSIQNICACLQDSTFPQRLLYFLLGECSWIKQRFENVKMIT